MCMMHVYRCATSVTGLNHRPEPQTSFTDLNHMDIMAPRATIVPPCFRLPLSQFKSYNGISASSQGAVPSCAIAIQAFQTGVATLAAQQGATATQKRACCCYTDSCNSPGAMNCCLSSNVYQRFPAFAARRCLQCSSFKDRSEAHVLAWSVLCVVTDTKDAGLLM